MSPRLWIEFVHACYRLLEVRTNGLKRLFVVSALIAICLQASADEVDGPTSGNHTLDGKVMVGYQGWFSCEGDGSNLGWTHWSRDRRKPFAPGNVTVDLWPDVSEFDADERFTTGFKHTDGRAGEVFSSANRKTVIRHFEWMRDYGIDGAFLQRFAVGLGREPEKRHKDRVLSNVRQGAKETGRTYAIMYDLSGLSEGGCRIVQDDWSNLRREASVCDDAAYQRHNGKPIVAVWGVGFAGEEKPREYTLAECRELIEFLKDDGCSVLLGVPTGWRRLDRDAMRDPDLHSVLKLADVISPWTVGRYRDIPGVQRHAAANWQPDKPWSDSHGLDYMPVVFPGFSWHNLKGDELDSIPRLKGKFFWSQVVAAKRSGCEMLYVAMFDEVDEGTAIFKCSSDPPTGNGAKFVSYGDVPSDHYLKLAGEAGKLLRGEISSEPPE